MGVAVQERLRTAALPLAQRRFEGEQAFVHLPPLRGEPITEVVNKGGDHVQQGPLGVLVRLLKLPGAAFGDVAAVSETFVLPPGCMEASQALDRLLTQRPVWGQRGRRLPVGVG